MDAYKPVPVVNIPPMSFIGVPSKQGITGNIHGVWDPDRSVAVVTSVVVPVEESLPGIGVNSRRAVVNLECDGE